MSDDATFRDLLLSRPRRALWPGSTDVWKYREAASVLASFAFAALRPTGAVTSSAAKTELLADCNIAHAEDGMLTWSLRRAVRQAALRRLLDSGSVESALRSNPQRPRTPEQSLLELYLTGGELLPSDPRWSADGPALLQVAEWLADMPEFAARLPSIDGIRRRIESQQLLRPFRELVGESFAGRRRELARLSDYVGARDPGSFAASVSRVVDQVFSITDSPPLFINGPGGCGKSTLIARFILDHADLEDSSQFPFAYLDFDRSGLVPEEPITLLMEIMRQLAIEFPGMGASYQNIAEAWAERLTAQLSSPFQRKTPSPRAYFRLADRGQYLEEFAAFVNDLKNNDQPLLLVLDTFEEIQFRSMAFADEVLHFLDELQSRVPRLRTVLAGRAEIHSERFRVRTMLIGNFDRDAAVAYLRGRGIRDEKTATTVFEQVGGSPLVLRLAADVARLEDTGATGITDLQGGWLSLFRTQCIEVVLYKRILSHVYDERVQQLAYPGLVLRAITPELVKDVLAGPCGVSVASPVDARQLVATMAAQLTTILVPSPSDREHLVHRPDMRAILLQDLREKSQKDSTLAERLRAIHRAAISYYEKREGPAQRAEEIYHRLALGVERATLDDRWQSGLGPFLGSSVLELPDEGQVYLAARLGLELPAKRWLAAPDDDWVFYAARASAQLLELDKPSAALDLLAARPHLFDHQVLRSVAVETASEVMSGYARKYESLRESLPSGTERTSAMNSLVDAVTKTSLKLPRDPSYPSRLFLQNTAGARIVGLALALADPQPEHISLAIEGIRHARSPFEQYHALRLAQRTLDSAPASTRSLLREAIEHPQGVPIHESDKSRVRLKGALLERLAVKKA